MTLTGTAPVSFAVDSHGLVEVVPHSSDPGADLESGPSQESGSSHE